MIYELNIRYGATGKALAVKFAPTAPETRSARSGHTFVFGSASHPSDFRCQACGHFAWGWHAPEEAWKSDTRAIEKIGQAALELVKASKMKVSPAMAETLNAWREELAGE